MKIVTRYPLVDDLLSTYSEEISHDFPGYSNHVYRLLNFFAALTRSHGRLTDAALIAAVFHDIGIWTASTFDYLQPSTAQAKRHMLATRADTIDSEVTTLIANHHKIRAYEGAFADSAQPLKQADLIDVSLGMLRHGLPRSYVSGEKCISQRRLSSSSHWAGANAVHARAATTVSNAAVVTIIFV
ncbi:MULTISPECIES: hypothetical protein [Lysobacter]|uniref:hypothetical protein n=1 Tax=Lysobacter TaxID=68 RepID=UPI001F1FF6FB|nr:MULTISPECIES: hypothetical protein [Lysobacter]UJB21447.1 hypothetical protein L1A79_10515 [Lysobacter capsici]UJQ29436.1 hypothetical protein L2D09_04350 [Lysobacter gummosus]